MQNEKEPRLSMSTIRQKFTSDEDKNLKSLVKRLGTRNWEEVAKYMPGRNGRQCRDRYNNYLALNFKKGHWLPEEDKLIMQKYYEIGPKWVKIAKLLPYRSSNDVKNRFHKALAKRMQESSEIFDPVAVRPFPDPPVEVFDLADDIGWCEDDELKFAMVLWGEQGL